MTRSAPRLVTIVVPVRNDPAGLDRQLDALARQHGDTPYEVVVADDHSTDSTRHVATRWHAKDDRIRVVTLTDTTGSNAARNAGTTSGTGELILYCDADDIVDPDWLDTLTRAALAGDAVGGPVRASGPPRYFPFREPPDPRRRELGFLPRPYGANCGVWRDTYEALGGFDPAWTYGGADTEFFWRLQLAGHTIAWSPPNGPGVAKLERSTLRAIAAQHYRWGRAAVRLANAFELPSRRHSASRNAPRRTAPQALRCVPTRVIAAVVRIVAVRVGHRVGRASQPPQTRALHTPAGASV